MLKLPGNWATTIKFAKRFKGAFGKAVLANVFGCLAACLQLSIPLATIRIINKAIPDKNYHLLLQLSAFMASAALVSLALSGLEGYYAAAFREKASVKLEMLLFQHVQHQPYLFFKTHESGYIMSRISNDNAAALELISSFTTSGRTLAMLGAGLVLLPVFNLRLGFTILCVLPFYAATVLFFNLRTRKAFVEVSERTAQSSRELFESLSGIYETKAYVAEKYRARRYLARLAERARTLVKGRFLMSSGEQLTHAVSFLLSLVIIGWGGAKVIAGQLRLGELIGFTTVAAYLLYPINILVQHVLRWQKAIASIQRIEEIFKIPIEQQVDAEPGPAVVLNAAESRLRVQGHIRFQNVAFGYKDRPLLLRDINLEVMPGEVVLITGQSGVGKTSLVSMLPRFVDPLEGTIYIDGIPIKAIPLKELRRQIAYVSQDVFLFSDTIANNIRIGNRMASDEDVYQAARMANALQFIQAMPEGVHTQVGERGARLSGGQRQRISIARAILRNAPILILDEATSAVDPGTEALVHQSLSLLMRGRTTIIIAHHAAAFMENVSKNLNLENGNLCVEECFWTK